MPILTAGESYAFNRDLDLYQCDEIAANKRDDYVESTVNDSMREGGEYYPFTLEKVTEALTQMCLADQAMLAAYLKKCNNRHDDFVAHTYLADFMLDRVNDYWHEMAVHAAKEQYDKAGF